MTHNSNQALTQSTRKLGNTVEEWVCTQLIQKGFVLITENYTTPFGEIDLIMMDVEDDTLVFIEVRYRQNSDYGEGFETISRAKQRKIITTAKCFIRYKPSLSDRPIRFDVASVSGITPNLKLDWIPDAFM